jgi:DNA polymerase (family 10)
MNQEIAKILHEMSVLMEMKGVEFKPHALEKAAYNIESLEEDVFDIYKKGGIKELQKIPGVGRSIAEKIEEYIKTKRVKEHMALKKKIPVDVEELSGVEGIGPKHILELYKKLGIKNKNQLESAAKKGRVAKIPGFGEKTEKNILRSIRFLRKSHGRFLLGSVMPIVESIIEKLDKVSGVQKVDFAGSIRRMQETVGDLDILVISKNPSKVMDAFVTLPEVRAVYSKGKTRSSVRLKMGMDADLRVVPPESFGSALQYFTGDKYHNVKLRQIAIKKGYKLNEYGLYKGKKLVAGKTEEEIYKKLGLQFMPPELRTNTGELDAAAKKKIPSVVGYGDVRGDLQIQTDWTDGEDSIEDMAKKAKEQGLSYLCITDHTKTLAMTGGCDEKKLLRQLKAIDKAQKKVKGVKILKGAEVNILKDGTLDIEDKVLAKLDVVGAAVHTSFGLPRKMQTARIIKAMENPNVDIIFHPTGRIIHKREAYDLDMDEIFKAAKRTKTVLEINAFPDRLDLKDEYIRKAVQMGIKFSISTDAHSMEHIEYLKYGIAQARRGWCTKHDIINTHDWREMLKLLK